MINTKRKFTKRMVGSMVSLLMISGVSLANNTEISKPKGAMGTGTAQANQAKTNQFWWPEQLNLSALRDHDSRSNPFGSDFDYAKAFSKLDLAAAKKDIDTVIDSKKRGWNDGI